MMDGCVVCQMLKKEVCPPGGVIYENETWLLAHSLPPVFIPGKLTLKLKRHRENLSELSTQESVALGPLIQRVCQVLQRVTRAEKVHVASYGEGISHVHFLITPRTENLPASNIQLTFWLLWRRGLYQLRNRGVVFGDGDVIEICDQIRQALMVG